MPRLRRIFSLLYTLLPLAAIGQQATEMPVRISTPAAAAQAADLAIDSAGTVHVVWLGENTAAPNAEQIARRGHSHDSNSNLYYARSTDGGLSFDTPRTLNTENGDVWGFAISKPRIAIGRNDSVHVLYPGNSFNEKTGKNETMALYQRSTDTGRSFSVPRRLNVDALDDALDKNDGGSFSAIATDQRGSVYAMWVDTREMGDDDYGRVFLSVSLDDGVTFARDHQVFAAEICPCCQLQLIIDPQDRLIVGLRDVEGPYRDNAISISTDGGASFGPRKRVSGARWELNGCPRKPTAIARHDDHRDGERREHWAAAYYSAVESPAGAYTVTSRDGNRWSTPRPLHKDAVLSDAPMLTYVGDKLLAVWQARVDAERRETQIFFAEAATTAHREEPGFGPPRAISSGPGQARLPTIAPFADGAVYVVWQQDGAILGRRIKLTN